MTAPRDTPSIRVLGVDPGTRVVGLGLLDHAPGRARFLRCDVIRAPVGAPMGERLLAIHDAFTEVLDRERPQVVALESAFVGKNFASALAMGQGRGVVLLCAARARLPVFEYTPAAVKRAIAGFGGADKEQLAQWIAKLLDLPQAPTPHDAADALAIALTHVHRRPSEGLRAAIEGERDGRVLPF